MAKVLDEVVVSEATSIGRYRVRIVENKGRQYLDIREYVDNEEFTGFTRKGIRLKSTEAAELLESLRSDPGCREFLTAGKGGN